MGYAFYQPQKCPFRVRRPCICSPKEVKEDLGSANLNPNGWNAGGLADAASTARVVWPTSFENMCLPIPQRCLSYHDIRQVIGVVAEGEVAPFGGRAQRVEVGAEHVLDRVPGSQNITSSIKRTP
jgi:hypothetical protein